MSSISIGLSALQAAQQGLAIAGNNLTNASTPGYHLEEAQVSTAPSTSLDGLSVGTGVQVTGINRVVSQQLDTALNQQASATGFTNSSLNVSTQVQQAVNTNTTSPSTQLESLLNSIESLSANPSDASSQQAVVESAQQVAVSFNTAATDLSQLQQSTSQSISADVNQINEYTSQIASLNKQISTATGLGGSPDSLLDQRDQLVSELSQVTNATVQNGNNGQITVEVSGYPVVVGTTSQALTAGTDSNGNAIVTSSDSTQTINITGGDLGGLLSQQNGTLANFQTQLDTLAKQVISSFNEIQATGLNSSGGYSSLTSQNAVTSTTAPLNSAGLSFSPTSGSLYIGVTDTATGQRTITQVPIDPQSDSLQDVANAISTDVPNLTAMVNTQSGTLTLTAGNGYTFDFAGGYEASPATNFTGGSTTTPTIGGTYTGSSNDQYTVTFNSSGTIGSTSGLQAQVTNASGSVIGTINVGQGYQVGQPITLANGVTVSLTAGSAVQGDSFSTPVVSNSDSSNILSSLGINSFFTGNNATSIAVSSTLTNNPSQISVSTTGEAGDTTNLQRFSALGGANVMNGGTQTFSGYANQMVSNIGSQVQTLTNQQSTNQTLTTSLTNQQQSVSGVDTNQQLSDVMQYQQQFEMAGKYISAINDAIYQLINDVVVQ